MTKQGEGKKNVGKNLYSGLIWRFWGFNEPPLTNRATSDPKTTAGAA